MYETGLRRDKNHQNFLLLENVFSRKMKENFIMKFISGGYRNFVIAAAVNSLYSITPPFYTPLRKIFKWLSTHLSDDVSSVATNILI